MDIREEVVNVTRELVKFRSTSENPEQVKECADYIQDFFKDSNVQIHRFDYKNVPSLFITIKETMNPKVIMNAHFDVVPAEDKMFDLRVQDNMMFGRGVYDDKGPLAVAMVLFKELAGRKTRHDIALLVTGDEEVGGRHGVKYLLEEIGIRSDFAVVLDGGSLNSYVVEAKGILRARFEAKGLAAHGSRPWLGQNAIETLMKVYPKVKKLFKEEATADDRWKTTLNLSVIEGGSADNMVPGEAQMMLDIRFISLDEAESILEELRKIMRETKGIKLYTKRRPMFSVDMEDENVKKLLKISKEVFEEDPELRKEDGGSDAAFFSIAGIPSLLTRPRGGGLHSPTEHMDLEHIDEFYKTLKKFMTSF